MRAYHGELFKRLCQEVQQNVGNKWPENASEIPWKDVELLLYFAMMDLKPVGVNRNFMMLFIHDRFTNYVNKQVYSKAIWDHLDSMYDMAALHESEILPFPSDDIDYELPSHLDDLVMEKFGISLQHASTEESSQSKNITSLKSSRKMSASKLKPNVTPIANKTKEVVHSKQAVLSTPVSLKSGKSTPSVKSDEKPILNDSSVNKGKQEVQMPAKISKNKRSSSPFSTKSTKSETATSREHSPDIPLIRKPKPERSGSPATIKKSSSKVELNSTPISSKKGVKEPGTSSSKTVKSEAADTVKKVKNDRDSTNKKGKSSSSETPVTKKSGKIDSSNGNRKLKSDSEGNAKKVESSSTKQLKVDVKNIQTSNTKGLKLDDADALFLSGSRKSSPMVKLEPVDSLKKRKRQKVEESHKKPTPPPKRRRT